jgi:hypothetical protein
MPCHFHGKPQHVHRKQVDTSHYQLEFACMTTQNIAENKKKQTTEEKKHVF